MHASDRSARDIRAFTEQNRRAWNEIALPRRGMACPPEFFIDGKITIPDDAMAIIGDVRGKRVLNLQCANGEDAISFAALGAEVVGVDISDVVIEIARDIAAKAGIDVSFVRADVYDLPADLQQRDFDLVWSRAGIVCWLPDLDAWAARVSSALRPGARFVLADTHPFVQCVWFVDGGIEIRRDYFGRSEPNAATDLGKIGCGASSNETHYDFRWPLGDVVTAVARAGMRIESLEEFPVQEPPYNRADRPDVRAPELVLRLPGSYRLVALREDDVVS